LARTGVASGATSWNLAGGQLDLSFDGSASPSLDSVGGRLVLERRAGTILIDFPLLQIASLDPVSIDLTVASADDAMTNPVIGTSAVDAAGATSLIVFETPEALAARVELLPLDALRVPLATVASLVASNTSTGSRAAVALVEADFHGAGPASPLVTFDEACVKEVLGVCVASLGVSFDFSGMTLSMTTLDAIGTSPLSIPTPRPVPLPPALWLLAAAVGGLAWVRWPAGPAVMLESGRRRAH